MNAGDTAWVLTASALVLLMLPALAMFYGGLVRGRSVLNTWMMVLAMLAVVGVQWVLWGYSAAFGPGSPALGGLAWAGLGGVGTAPHPAYGASVPHLLFAAFQGLFAVVAAGLVAGALVERMRFPAFLAFGLLWTGLVYDPLARWVWAESGWLRRLGALDFAGGLPVHVAAGVSALVAAAVLGPRRSWRRGGEAPHQVPMTLAGAGFLAVGWCGFNGGSALAADGAAALALVNSLAAGAAAMAAWMLLDRLSGAAPGAVGAATALVVGLVAVTPAAGYVRPGAALAVGALGAAASYGALALKARLPVDDALDVFACHGAAGIAGTLLTGLFAPAPGGRLALLGIQAGALAAVAAFSALATLAVMGALWLFIPLRVGLEEEVGGLDPGQHGEQAYAGPGGPGPEGGCLGEPVLLPPEDLGVLRDGLERPV